MSRSSPGQSSGGPRRGGQRSLAIAAAAGGVTQASLSPKAASLRGGRRPSSKFAAALGGLGALAGLVQRRLLLRGAGSGVGASLSLLTDFLGKTLQRRSSLGSCHLLS